MKTVDLQEIRPILEAVQVTDENWMEVMEWCGGHHYPQYEDRLFQFENDLRSWVLVRAGDWVVFNPDTGQFEKISRSEIGRYAIL